jgi:hypothetical protein
MCSECGKRIGSGQDRAADVRQISVVALNGKGFVKAAGSGRQTLRPETGV